MLPGMELMGCTELAVPAEVMQHVVRVESSFNPYAIGVVGGRLARQPRSLPEAVSTARMLEREGYNFSLGLAQVNRHNLASQGLDSYEHAFDTCPNLRAGARILADCYRRATDDWGKALSCYYSGNFVTGFRHGYVHKVLASWQGESAPGAIPVIERRAASAKTAFAPGRGSLMQRRMQDSPEPPTAEPAGPASGFLNPQMTTDLRPAREVPSLPVPRQDNSSPVLVQPMQARASQQAPGAKPEQASPRGGPSADDAFVFQQ